MLAADEANLHDVLMFIFIYIHSYKLPRADMSLWPSTSAFDGYLSAHSPTKISF